jgi:hypothetical protein
MTKTHATLTETVYRRTLRPFGKTPGSLTKVHLQDGLADELLRWKTECKKTSCKKAFCTKPEHRKASSEEFIFQNADGGFMDADNYRFCVLKPLAGSLGIPKLNFQVMRRTMATQAQRMGSVKDIQAHLRHSGAPETFAAGHDGQRVHARASRERTGDDRIGVRDADERRKKSVFRRFATKRRKCFDRQTA